ncbi:hypothetical protein OAX78_04365 [Planctomycetota bacterium]|nr:hypothetical protein [Planctomycetota bacterium]
MRQAETRAGDLLHEAAPSTTSWGRAILAAGLRGACVGTVLGLILGPYGWPLLGVVVAAAALVERWGSMGPASRRVKAFVLIWLIGLVGVPLAFLNGIYLQGLVETGSWSVAFDLVEQSWRSLSEHTVDRGLPTGNWAGWPIWLQVFPWADMWVWAASPDTLRDTARLTATILATASLGPLHSRGFGGSLLGFVAVPVAMLIAPSLIPPDVFHVHPVTSGQGFTESIQFLAYAVGVAWLVAMSRMLVQQIDRADPRPLLESPHGPPPMAFAAFVGATLLLACGGLVLGPRVAEPRVETPWLKALETGDAAERNLALSQFRRDPTRGVHATPELIAILRGPDAERARYASWILSCSWLHTMPESLRAECVAAHARKTR